MRYTVLLAALLSAGCASTYKNETVAAVSTKLPVGSSVLIAVPADAAYGGESYPGSGLAAATATRSAFARYATKTDLAEGCDRIDCLVTTPESYAYFVVPEILHWEDRATEWSGKRDKVEVKVTVFDAQKRVLASQIINGKSKFATFGGDRPQDLLPQPLAEYVQTLFN